MQGLALGNRTIKQMVRQFVATKQIKDKRLRLTLARHWFDSRQQKVIEARLKLQSQATSSNSSFARPTPAHETKLIYERGCTGDRGNVLWG